MAYMGSESRPWQTARLEHGEWLRVFQDSVNRWGASLDAVQASFYGDLPGEHRELVRQEREAFTEHLKVYEGDPETCRRIRQRLGDSAQR